MTTLLPAEQRVYDALTAEGLALTDPVPRATLETLAAHLGWLPATVKREIHVVRQVLQQHPPPRPAGTLTPREECLVDELEAQGYAVYHRVTEDALLTVAAHMGLSLSAVRNLLNKVRKAWGVEAQGLKHPQTGLLPEAPVLPLGCVDPVVIARCQRRECW